MKFARTAVATVAMLVAAPAFAQSGMDHSRMGGMDPSMMQPTAANPYTPAEMKMHDKMMRAVGADATETWVRKMVEHHRGAIEMSQIVLRNTRDPKIRAMATKSVSEQSRDIGQLQAWLSQHRKRAQ